MYGVGHNSRDDWGSGLRKYTNPIFRFNMEGSQFNLDFNLNGSSNEMGQVNMEHDNVEEKKMTRINVLIPNVSELSDSTGIIVEKNYVHIHQRSAAANRQAD